MTEREKIPFVKKLGLILLSFVAVVGGYSVQGAEICGCSRSAQQPSVPGNDDKAAVALAFINGYVENCLDSQSRADVVAWVDANSLATAGLKRELQRMVDEAAEKDPELGLNFDPLFYAQDFPDAGFELDALDQRSGCLILRGKDWPEFNLRMKVVNEHGRWLVDGCGAVNMPDQMRRGMK